MASIDKRPDGSWRARWREYPGGPQRTKHFARKVDADRHLVTVRHDLMAGTYISPEALRTTVAEYYELWSARQNWRPSTKASVETRFKMHVLPTFGDRPVASLRRGDVEAWVAGRKLAPSTTGVALQQLSSMLEAAVLDGLIARNPAKGVRRPKREAPPIVPLVAEEVDRLLEAATPAMKVAIVLGARCGLRHAEAAGVTRDRLDFLRRELKVDRQLLTNRTGLGTSFGPLKTDNSYRTVPLDESTLLTLSELVGRDGEDGDLLVHEDGVPVNAARFGQLWRRARRDAGVAERARFHDTRHTYASILLSHGVSVAATAELLGDTPAVVLGTYAHLMPADHDRARAAIQAAFARADDSPAAVAGSSG